MNELLEEYQRRLRKALVQIQEMDAQLKARDNERREPIAIVGMACRFPGDCSTPTEFMRFLMNGNDAVTEIPSERKRLFSSDTLAGDGELSAMRWGAFLRDIDLFDASFFELAPREVARMDPQQRILLEVSWEAFENAGVVLDLNRKTRTGVFVGFTSNDYSGLATRLEPEHFEIYDVTGNGHCFPAGRIAYQFGVQGPTISIDTACSSSLVATHLACQSLRFKECDVALVAGVNLLLAPHVTRAFARSQAISPDGRARTFDAHANGFVRGEGCGAIVLMRQSDAYRDGYRIVASILGSVINQDGRSAGFTAPSMGAQQALIEEALRRARVLPEDIGFIETHGTGTALGDPIEADALCAALGVRRNHAQSCHLGALKTNVGHLEAAAGIAGLIKTACILQADWIPKNLHFRALNPRISFDGTALAIPTENTPWPRGNKPRHAGVSSFGMSGTNAHVILREPPQEERNAPALQASTYLLPLSAKSQQALVAMANSYAQWLSRVDQTSLDDVVYTASVRRTHHEHRLAVVASDRDELARGLASFARGETPETVMLDEGNTPHPPQVVFVFPGQGSQWLGMGRQLFAEEPVFRAALEACDRAIVREAEFSVIEQVAADGAHSRLDEIDVVQPFLFAMGVALAALWRSWGIEPDCVVGHSMGEAAAAHVAGILTLEDATKVICRRSRLLKRIRGQGAMALVELPIADAERVILAHTSKLGIAVSNGPRSTVLSGDPHALEDVLGALERSGVFCRRIRVDVASHSPQVEPLRADLLHELRDLRPTAAKLQMHSTVTGKLLQGSELEAAYWWDNLRQPVRFSQVTYSLMQDPHSIFIEMSPHPILLPAIEENLREAGARGTAIASLRRQTDEQRTMLEALGSLYVRGCSVRWDKRFPNRGRIVALPSYPWQRERYWVDAPRKPPRAKTPKVEHVLLGAPSCLSSAPREQFWTNELSIEEIPYLADHRVGGQPLVPGSVYVESALAAAQCRLGNVPIVLNDFSFISPLVMEAKHTRRTHVSFERMADGRWAFRFSSLNSGSDAAHDENSWTLHAHALCSVAVPDGGGRDRITLRQARERCHEGIALDDVLQMESQWGFDMGPAFQAIRQIRRFGTETLGRLELPEQVARSADSYLIHPVLLDAALRVAAMAVPRNGVDAPRILTHVGCMSWFGGSGTTAWCHGVYEAAGNNCLSCAVFDDDGNLVMLMEGIETKTQHICSPEDALHRNVFIGQTWVPVDVPAVAVRNPGRWLVLCDEAGIDEPLCQHLTEAGHEVTRLWQSEEGRGGRSTPVDSSFQVDTSSPDEMRAIVVRILERGSLTGIIDCWGMSSHVTRSMSADGFASAFDASCAGTLLLAKTLAGLPIRDMPRLWMVCRGAQFVPNESRPVDVMQAPRWGFGRMIALEYPELRCTRVDLDPLGNFPGDQFVSELLASAGDDELAFRGARRYVGRLGRLRLTPTAGDRSVIAPDATYLVSGGLGAAGLLSAKWLVQCGARHIVLMDKGEVLAPDALAELAAGDVAVSVVTADVTDPAQLENVLLAIDAKPYPLKGIIHCVGASSLGPLARQDFARLRSAAVSRIIGGWNVHLATLHRSLDFLVFFSSLHVLFGSPLLGVDVLGSSFFDALSQDRFEHGLAALSIQWGPLAGVKPRTEQVGEQMLAEHGMNDLSSDDGVVLFMRALSEPRAQLGIASLDVQQWLESHPYATVLPRFRSLLPAEQDTSRPSAHKSSALLDRLKDSSPLVREQLLEAFVREQLAGILRMDPDRIDRLAPLRKLGIDSLMSLELRNRLEKVIPIRLSATLVFSHPNLGALVRHLMEQVGFLSERVPPHLIGVSAPTADEPIATRDFALTTEAVDFDDKLFEAFDKTLQRVRDRRAN